MNNKSRDLMPVSPFSGISGINDVIHNTALFMSGSNERARMVIVVASNHLEHILEKKKRIVSFKKLSSNPKIYLCRSLLHDTDSHDQPNISEWLMIDYNNSNTYLIISFTNYKDFKGILKFFKGLYPKIARTFFDTAFIYNFLRGIDKEDNRLTIRITKLVAKKRIDSEGAQKLIASSIDWTDLSYQEAFSKLYEDNAWVKSIDLNLSISDNGSTYESAGSITRDGSLICKKNFKFFYYQVIQKALQKAAKDKELFTNRSRKENPGLKVRPLVINFNKPIFRDKTYNHRLISALRKMPNSSLSVFHANPYLQASMIDYSDGSTYRLWVLSENSITIVPQMRATIGSLQRVFNHIGERFMEGKVAELSE